MTHMHTSLISIPSSQRPNQGPIKRVSETFIKASTCYSIDADASAVLQSNTERHQQLKMAPIHQTREEQAPASEQPQPLLHVLIRLRSLRDIAAAVDGLSLHHKSDWFHFVTEQNVYHSQRRSSEWRVYLSPNKDAA